MNKWEIVYFELFKIWGQLRDVGRIVGCRPSDLPFALMLVGSEATIAGLMRFAEAKWRESVDAGSGTIDETEKTPPKVPANHRRRLARDGGVLQLRQ